MQISLKKAGLLESTITRLLQKNDQTAITLIYENYSASLYGVIYKIVQSEESAQEVLQDCFVKIWQNSSKYNSEKGRLFTWLINIARNSAIDKIRSAPFRRARELQSMFDKDGLQKEIGLSHIIIADMGLQKIISALKEDHRILIDLIYFQGYSQREVEKMLLIPLGTVKSRLRIAIRELRKMLTGEQQFLLMSA